MILPQMIFWDWDKTIVEQHGLIEKLKEMTLKKFTSEPVYQKYKDILNSHNGSSREIFEEIFGDKLEEATTYFYDNYKELHIKMLSPKEGIKDVLDFFFERIPYMTVVSNKRGDYLRKEVTHLGFDKYFKAIVGAGDAAKDKPHSEPVRKAMEESKAPFDPAEKIGANAWFVGDSIVDLQTAENVDCRSVIINSDTEDFKDKGADYLFESCIQFMKSCKERTL